MKNTIILFIVAFFLVSCTLETQYKLPKNQSIDTMLLGTWHPKNAKESLIFKANKEQTFSVTMIDAKDVETLLSANAYISIINGYKIIVLTHVSQEDKNMKTYSYYGYRLSKNSFNFRSINEVKDKTFKSDDDLLAYFKQNIHKNDFFGDWQEGFYKE